MREPLKQKRFQKDTALPYNNVYNISYWPQQLNHYDQLVVRFGPYKTDDLTGFSPSPKYRKQFSSAFVQQCIFDNLQQQGVLHRFPISPYELLSLIDRSVGQRSFNVCNHLVTLHRVPFMYNCCVFQPANAWSKTEKKYFLKIFQRFCHFQLYMCLLVKIHNI